MMHLPIAGIVSGGGSGPYLTTGKFIEALTNGEKYSKTEWWTGDNGNKFTVCMFLRHAGSADATGPIIFADGRADQTYRINLQMQLSWDDTANDNRFRLYVRDSANALVYQMTTLDKSAHGIAIGDWFALMLSVDFSASGVSPTVEFWTHKRGDASAIDIRDATPTFQQNGPRTLEFDYSGNGGVTFGGDVANYEQTDYDISEFWMDGPDVAVDWSDSAERAKYVDSNGKPVGQGSDGSGLIGTQPKIYAPDGDLTNNVGSEGNFTAVGTIGDAGTSPTD